MSQVLLKTFDDIKINFDEISRYYNGKKIPLNSDDLSLIEENKNIFSYNVLYIELPISIKENLIDFSYFSVKSNDLAINLKGAKKVILFIASVGTMIDRLIKKYSLISPLKALLFQAFGAERVESLCDEFCAFIKENYGNTKPRFSAGYGDLDLSTQKDIFALLKPSKINVSLGENLIMSPSKSVTAFVGICDKNENIKL
ncbi:MAG: hypothetical protein KBS91_00040, partial [Firmicutes bacterium]|nr:hypothetical protein [Candidatus Caballimonas caccae]